MVMLYVGGHYMGKLHDDPDLLTRLVRAGERVELRDETGNQLGRVIPTREPLIPWDPSITREEIDRRKAEPGLTLDELRERLGWK
jgi:hypothetical protein